MVRRRPKRQKADKRPEQLHSVQAINDEEARNARRRQFADEPRSRTVLSHPSPSKPMYNYAVDAGLFFFLLPFASQAETG